MPLVKCSIRCFVHEKFCVLDVSDSVAFAVMTMMSASSANDLILRNKHNQEPNGKLFVKINYNCI